MYVKARLENEGYMESVLSALIAGGLALIGVIITNASSNSKIEQQLAMAQAVTETKLETLTAEVKRHNDFAERVPVIEDRVHRMEDQIKELQRHVIQ